MFFRQFNWLLAYGSEDVPVGSVLHFVAKINPPPPDSNGFVAEFVGGSGIGQRVFRFFFPLELVHPEHPAPVHWVTRYSIKSLRFFCAAVKNIQKVYIVYHLLHG
jgi:hypothetical protein